MRLMGILAAAGLLLSSSAAMAAMNSEVFYQKAVKLEKKGMAAMFSKDLKPLMSEMKVAGKAVKAENEAAKKRGKPIYCPPKKSSMNSKQLIAEFRALGRAKRRSMNVRQAFRTILIKKYPCR
ncbi:MAG: hypothetical protein V3V15_08900 [Sphingorhabdus sp.]